MIKLIFLLNSIAQFLDGHCCELINGTPFIGGVPELRLLRSTKSNPLFTLTGRTVCPATNCTPKFSQS